jgi:hypothetical protein
VIKVRDADCLYNEGTVPPAHVEALRPENRVLCEVKQTAQRGALCALGETVACRR